MADTFHLSHPSLEALFQAILQDGRRILAPTDRNGRTELAAVHSPAELPAEWIQTVFSAKEAVFPKVERLLGYAFEGRDVRLADAEPQARPTVLFALRPCEAAAFRVLDAVFNWDTRDRFFNARRENLAIIGMSCTRKDEACFCASVGGGPGDTRGSDILLTPLEDGYLAEVLTDRGRAIQALAPQAFGPGDGAAKAERLAQVEKTFDQPALTAKLPALFSSPLWEEQSLRCLGCGACAFVCPTCACFDIQEEADARQGRRLRLWDSCGFPSFTLHASGHNPRDTQAQRWRQRVYHKFSYYPERHGMLGCVGCGKCTRACPVDMDLQEHLREAASHV